MEKGHPTGVRGPVTAGKGLLTGVHGWLTAVERVRTTGNGSVTAVKGLLTPVKGLMTVVGGLLTTVRGTVTAVKGAMTTVIGPMTAVRGPATTVVYWNFVKNASQMEERLINARHPEKKTAMPAGPFYDAATSLYDSGLHYAEFSGPTIKKPMAKIKLNLARMSAAQVISKATVIHGSIAPAAPATPPIPNMTARAAALLTAKNEATTAETDYQASLATTANKKVVRDQKVDALREEMRRTSSSAQSESNGDPAMLTAGGFDLADTAAATTEPPPKVLNLVVTAGDIDGTVAGGFDPCPTDANVNTYEIQCTTGDPVTGPWSTVLSQTASDFVLSGLTSGQRCWVRVRAINVVGPGGWSDPATKIVP